jgi:hypothetical protein
MRTFPIAVALAAVSAAVILALIFATIFGSIAHRFGARETNWRGAVVVKICHGTTIYRLRDGRIVTGGYRVENAETVCGAP